MRQYFLFVMLVLLTACNPTPQATIPAPSATPIVTTPTLDVKEFDSALRPEFRGDLDSVRTPTIYRMNLHLDPTLTQLSGQESVTYTNRQDALLNEIYFRLFANYPGNGGKIVVTDTRVNGVVVTPTLESQDTALHVPLATPLVPGKSLQLELNFEVTIPLSNTARYADFTNGAGIVTLPSVYPLIPAYDQKGWHVELPPPYGDLVYAEASMYDVRVTVPATLTVVASGLTVETSTQGNEQTWHIVGAPMRDFDLDASAAWQKSSAAVGDVAVNSYYLPEDEAAGQKALTWARSALEVYEKRIGAYPFKELDVVETPTDAGGIEYPGVVVISRALYENADRRDFFEFAVAHEVAHQWWYVQVGDDQVNTPWMDEALAQYTTLIYYQDAHGANAAANIRQNVFQLEYKHAQEQNQDLPIGMPVSSYSEGQYGQIVYGKAPLFFDAVRQQLGDEKFYQFLRTYYQDYKYQVAMPDDLRRTLSTVSGQSLDALYGQWGVEP